jgi:hypothetical protein
MSRLYIVVLLATLMQACAGIPFGDVLFPPTNTLAPSATATVTRTFTPTPRPTNTPRPTATATIVRFPTLDPSLPTATFVPIPIYIGKNTATPFSSGPPVFISPPGPGEGFVSVTVAPNKIYWGICKTNKTTIRAKVQDPDEVWSVVIFIRAKSAREEDYTPWTTGNAMHDHRDGTFSYVMRGIEVEGHNHYRDSWVQFQLVATNADGEDVGRTQIYSESIHLSPCMELGD